MNNKTLDHVAKFMENNQTILGKEEKKPIISNHTGYNYEGSENYEHDNTGDLMSLSEMEDEFNNAQSEHEGWEEGYDY